MHTQRTQKMYRRRAQRAAKYSHVMKRSSMQRTPTVGRYRKTTYSKPSQAALQYARAIMNPNLTGGKIPDSYGERTATVQLEQEYVINAVPIYPVSANNAGVGATKEQTCALIALTIGPNPTLHYLTSSSNLFVGATASGISGALSAAPAIATTLLGNTTAASTAYSAVLGAPSGSLTDKSQYSNLKAKEGDAGSGDNTVMYRALFKSARVVSAGINVEFSGQDSNNQGVINAAYFNHEYFTAAMNSSGTMSMDIELATNDKDTDTFSTAAPAQGTAGYQGAFPAASTTSYPANAPLPVQFEQGLLDSVIFNSKSGPRGLSNLGTYLRQQPVSAFGPSKLGCKMRYFPMDGEDVQFKPLYSSICSSQQLARQFVNGAFVIFAENLSDVGVSFVVKACVNLETTPREDNLSLVHSSSSPVDSMGIASAAKLFKKHNQIKIGGHLEALPLYP